MNKKFTLIEVLVVVAIIGIIASLLLPSLRRARNASTLATCGSQLKQINLAIHMFAEDFDNHTPPGGRNAGTYKSKEESPNSQHVDDKAVGYVENLAPYLGIDIDYTSIASMEDTTRDPDKMKAFICPVDGDPKEVNHTQYDAYHQFTAVMSYGCNAAVFSKHDDPARDVDNNLSLVPEPSQTVTLWDADPQMFGTWISHLWSSTNRPTLREWAQLDDTNSWGNIIKPDRHSNKMNISFVDGHVQSFDNTNYGSLAEAYLNEGFGN